MIIRWRIKSRDCSIELLMVCWQNDIAQICQNGLRRCCLVEEHAPQRSVLHNAALWGVFYNRSSAVDVNASMSRGRQANPVLTYETALRRFFASRRWRNQMMMADDGVRQLPMAGKWRTSGTQSFVSRRIPARYAALCIPGYGRVPSLCDERVQTEGCVDIYNRSSAVDVNASMSRGRQANPVLTCETALRRFFPHCAVDAIRCMAVDALFCVFWKE